MTLDLIHTNDLHDNFPQKTLDALLTPECILFDSGDAIGGSNTVYRAKEPILNKMNSVGYRAMAMGNREFHYLRRVLRQRQKTAQFPMMAANVVDLKNEVNIESVLYFTANRLKIGVFGLTVPQFPAYSSWERFTGWRFLEPFDIARNLASELREKGADFVICLSHLGFNRDRKMALDCPGIDLILGGHSHTILTKPYKENSTVILQSGAYGRFVGRWKLDVELENDRLKSWSIDGDLIEHND